MDTQQQQSTIKGVKVRMVGAGGIGSELIKTLALSEFEDIHIIDMDTIEFSNLFSQFIFSRSHIRQSKEEVATDAVFIIRTHINKRSYHANVKLFFAKRKKPHDIGHITFENAAAQFLSNLK